MEQTGKNIAFMRQVRAHDIDLKIAEPGLHNQPPAEGVVGEVGRQWYRTRSRKQVPKIFWDYGMQNNAENLCERSLDR